MRIKFNTLILAAITVLNSSCTEPNEQLVPSSNYECEFTVMENSTEGILDEDEIEIIMNCRSNEITNTSEIESNLIGEWELVGFGDGWFSHINQPCGYITIGNDELIFEFQNEYLDTISIHQWEIENNWLKVDPEEKHLSINLFCDEYMHGSFSDFGILTIDVDQYIYKKVN